MKRKAPTYLTYYFTLPNLQGVQAAVDTSRYDPATNAHLEAMLAFQNILEGRAQQAPTLWSPEKLNAVRLSRINQLYDPNNPMHVAALNQLQTALRDGAPPSLMESVQDRFSQIGKTVQSALSPSTYLGAVGSMVPSGAGVGGVVSSMVSYITPALAFLFRMAISILGSSLTMMFPPLAVLSSVNPLDLYKIIFP